MAASRPPRAKSRHWMPRPPHTRLWLVPEGPEECRDLFHVFCPPRCWRGCVWACSRRAFCHSELGHVPFPHRPPLLSPTNPPVRPSSRPFLRHCLQGGKMVRQTLSHESYPLWISTTGHESPCPGLDSHHDEINHPPAQTSNPRPMPRRSSSCFLGGRRLRRPALGPHLDMATCTTRHFRVQRRPLVRLS